jgi:hypothetical protein
MSRKGKTAKIIRNKTQEIINVKHYCRIYGGIYPGKLVASAEWKGARTC